MLRLRRRSLVQLDEPSWLRPLDPKRSGTVRFAPSLLTASDIVSPDAAARRLACMGQHPSAQARRQAVA